MRILDTLGLLPSIQRTLGRREIIWTRSGKAVASDANGTVPIRAFGLNDVGRYQAEVREFYSDGSVRTTKTDSIDLQLYRRSNNTDSDILAMDRLLDLKRQVTSRPRGIAALKERAHPLALTAGVTGQQVFRTEDSTRGIGEPVHGGEDSTNLPIERPSERLSRERDPMNFP